MKPEDSRAAKDTRSPSRRRDADVIALAKGKIDPQLLPEIANESRIAADDPKAVLPTGPVAGLNEMRDQIVRFVSDEGLVCRAEEVIVTNGAKHALDLACRAFLKPGDRVLVSEPSFLTGMRIIRSHHAEIIAVPEDDDGLDTVHLEKMLQRLEVAGECMPRLLFVVPDFGNPSGVCLSVERRRHLVNLARRFGFVVIEDAAYRRIRFEGQQIPPIKVFDDAGVVLMLGTFSKILAPGLRLGWVIGPPETVKRMASLRAEGGSPSFLQRIAIELMRNGRLNEQADRVTDTMRRRRDAAMAAVARYLPDVDFRRPEGSYFLWLRLPQDVPASAVSAKAMEEGVDVVSGRDWFPGSGPDCFLRLAYSSVSLEQLEEGIRRLGIAYQSVAQDA